MEKENAGLIPGIGEGEAARLEARGRERRRTEAGERRRAADG